METVEEFGFSYDDEVMVDHLWARVCLAKDVNLPLPDPMGWWPEDHPSVMMGIAARAYRSQN